MLISSGVVLLVTMFLSLFCALAFVGVYTLLGNGFGDFLVFTPFVCMKVYLCLWFWITYLVSLCFCCHYMCVLLSWVYYFNTFIFLFDLSHCHFFLVVCGSYCAFQTHDRLSYWQSSLSLSYSVLYCTFTIVLHLPHSILSWFLFEIMCDFYGLHSFLNLIELISVLCGVVFGSLLCACSFADVLSIL